MTQNIIERIFNFQALDDLTKISSKQVSLFTSMPIYFSLSVAQRLNFLRQKHVTAQDLLNADTVSHGQFVATEGVPSTVERVFEISD